jgi:DNA repair protein RadC
MNEAKLKLFKNYFLNINEAGKYLDIQVVLDHVIVTSEGYYSFTDEGVTYS